MYTNATGDSRTYLYDNDFVSTLLNIDAADGGKLFTNQEVFSEDSNFYVYISTPEQFVEFMQYRLRLDNPCYIIFKNNLYFQNDIKYREGFINGFYANSWGPATITFQADESLDEVILQGIQITGDWFFMGESQTSVETSKIYFKNIYLKDCVHTKISSDNSYSRRTFAWENSSAKNKAIIQNCKISFHIRAGEYGYAFDSEGWKWEKSSRYIEYSDVDTESIPSAYQTLFFKGGTDSCATIVRNMAAKISSSDGIILFTKDTVNSSWDVEFYKLVYYGMGDLYQNHAIHFSTNNCFVSVKFANIIDNTEGQVTLPEHQIYFDDGNIQVATIGVNIFNKGTTEHPVKMYPNSNVAQLTDTECHDINKLNQYGFFVNRAYTFTLLTSKPSNWDTDYNTYYIKVGRAYTINNSNVWATNTYYQKVYL